MRHKRSKERAMKEIVRNGIPVRRSTPRRTEQNRDPQYLGWLRSEGRCAVCVTFRGTGDVKAGFLEGFCDPCHTENGGASMKGPDSGCAPLCRTHHDQYDGRMRLPNGEVGKRAFEAHYGLDMRAVAAKWYKQYLETR